MRTDAGHVGRMLLVAAALLTFGSTSAASDNKTGRTSNPGSNLPATSDVRASTPSESPSATTAAAAPNKQVIRQAIASTTLDEIDRNIAKLSTTVQKMFKDFRPGSCPSVPTRRPTSSWPSRSEAAISVCRP